MILGEVLKENWPTFTGMTITPTMVWMGGGYLVQAYDEPGGIVRLTVNSVIRDQQNSRHWADRIPWDDLQAIKSACGYGDRDAVEVYPRTVDLVNVANMRHLWVLPEPVAFAWRKGGTK